MVKPEQTKQKTWKDVIDFIASKQDTDEDAAKILGVIGNNEPGNRMHSDAINMLCAKLTFELCISRISNNAITPEFWASYYPITLHGIDCNYESQHKEFSRLQEKTIAYATELFGISADDFIEILNTYKDDIRCK